jgi:hypothetical protein
MPFVVAMVGFVILSALIRLGVRARSMTRIEQYVERLGGRVLDISRRPIGDRRDRSTFLVKYIDAQGQACTAWCIVSAFAEVQLFDMHQQPPID